MPFGSLFKSLFGTPAKDAETTPAAPRLRHRRFLRNNAYKPCEVIYPSGYIRRGVVVDLSERGVRIRFSSRATLPHRVAVRVQGIPGSREATVAWHDHIDAGLRFRA